MYKWFKKNNTSKNNFLVKDKTTLFENGGDKEVLNIIIKFL